MKCPVCSSDVTEAKFIHHLKAYHLGESELYIPCYLCCETFSTIPTFHKHWYAKHHISKKRALVPIECKKVSDVSHSSVPSCSDEGGSEPPVKKLCQPPSECCDQFSGNIVSDIHLEANSALIVTPECGKRLTVRVSDKCHPALTSVSDQDIEVVSEVYESDSGDAESIIDDELPDLEDSVAVRVNDKDVISAENNCVLEESAEDVNSSMQGESGCSDHEPFQKRFTNINANAAAFVLGLREKSGMKRNSVLEIMNSTEALIKNSVENFAAEVETKLKEKHNTTLNDLMDWKQFTSSTFKIFDGLRTIYQQNKVFKDSLGVVSPKRIPLGREFKRIRKTGSSGRSTVLYHDEFVYIPLKDLVSKLVNHPDYDYFVENGGSSNNSDILDNYMKGDLSKKNPILQKNPDAIRFILYFDDLEVCSPLKSRAGKQKLGAFYILFDNIPAKFRSNLSLICLLALVTSKLVRESKYGIDSALEQLVEDIRKFEQGVILSNGVKVYGTLVAVIGDNLGVHTLGGFKEGFTAHRCCRFCMATFEDFQTMTSEVDILLRNKDSHMQHVNEVQTARGKNTALSTEYGVNRDSKLNNLDSFHVTESMPPDLMHDILEGVVPLTIKRLLNYLLYDKSQKKFTLEWLNQSVNDYDFEYSEVADKPSEIKIAHLAVDGSLHQSASQMWLLAVILPLILSPYVSIDDKHWNNFLDLLEICRIVFTVKISKWMISYLKDLIETYLSDSLELYMHLTPKMHFLIHYPTQILKFGSLVNYMCMRCEAKHKFFKQLVNVLGNYKNIPMTLAEKHQMHQSYKWAKSLLRGVVCGPKTVMDVEKSTIRQFLPVSVKMTITKWLELDGIKFVSDRCFIAVQCHDCLPVFAKITQIIVSPEVLFVCTPVRTIRRDIHSASFVIEILHGRSIYKPQDMITPCVFHSHSVHGSLHVVTKLCIGDAL